MKKIVSLILVILMLSLAFVSCSEEPAVAPEGMKLVSGDDCAYNLFVPENWKGLNTDIDSNPNLFAWQISGPLPVYDSETGDVTYTTIEDIVSYRTAADECVKLLVKTNNTVVVDAVIYR